MKQIILFFFVLLPFCTFSQVNESFDGTEINAGWIGARDSFEITTEGRLQLNINPDTSGFVSIGMNIDYAANMQWEFDVQMDGAPSDNNKLCVYLYREEKAFYYVRIGFNKQNGQDCDLALRKSEEDMFPRKENSYQKGMWVHIKVTLENNSLWTLYSRQHDVSYYIKEGVVPCTVIPEEKGQFSFKFFYTKSLSKMFSIDNVIIQHEITPTDTIPEQSEDDLIFPTLLELSQESSTELLLTFNKQVAPNQYQISLSELGEVADVYISDDEKILKLIWNTPMQKDKNYTLSYAGVFDLMGNECKGDTTFLSIYGEKQAEITKPGSIVINEIMADPKGLNNIQVEGKLPDTEYVELYNTTDSEISLANWQFSYGGSAKPIGSLVLSGRSHAVLYRAGREIKIDMTGKAWPMDNFPASLANTGKTLQLLDPADNVIDEVTYSKATPAKSWERSSSGEWKLSTDPRGGTPGSENSSQEGEKPDDPEQPSDPDEPTSPTVSTILPGEILFNELLPDPYSGGSEYIELYNCSDKTLSLSGLSVATRKMDGTLSTHYPLSSASRILNPGEFALITKSIEGVSSFYLISSPETLCEVSKLPVLANTSSTLVLFRTSDETVIDEVSYSSKWHASSIKDKKGVALERISPEGDTQDPANWTSASEVVGYGTPGYQNSQYHSSADGDATGIEDPIYQEDRHNYIIPYHLDQPGYNCRIFIYAISGQRISEIANHELLGTNGQLTWDGILSSGRPLQAGVYILYAEIYHPSGKVLRYKKPFLVH